MQSSSVYDQSLIWVRFNKSLLSKGFAFSVQWMLQSVSSLGNLKSDRKREGDRSNRLVCRRLNCKSNFGIHGYIDKVVQLSSTQATSRQQRKCHVCPQDSTVQLFEKSNVCLIPPMFFLVMSPNDEAAANYLSRTVPFLVTLPNIKALNCFCAFFRSFMCPPFDLA